MTRPGDDEPVQGCPNCPPGYDCESGNYYTGDVEIRRLPDDDPMSIRLNEALDRRIARDEEAAR